MDGKSGTTYINSNSFWGVSMVKLGLLCRASMCAVDAISRLFLSASKYNVQRQVSEREVNAYDYCTYLPYDSNNSWSQSFIHTTGRVPSTLEFPKISCSKGETRGRTKEACQLVPRSTAVMVFFFFFLHQICRFASYSAAAAAAASSCSPVCDVDGWRSAAEMQQHPRMS